MIVFLVAYLATSVAAIGAMQCPSAYTKTVFASTCVTSNTINTFCRCSGSSNYANSTTCSSSATASLRCSGPAQCIRTFLRDALVTNLERPTTNLVPASGCFIGNSQLYAAWLAYPLGGTSLLAQCQFEACQLLSANNEAASCGEVTIEAANAICNSDTLGAQPFAATPASYSFQGLLRFSSVGPNLVSALRLGDATAYLITDALRIDLANRLSASNRLNVFVSRYEWDAPTSTLAAQFKVLTADTKFNASTAATLLPLWNSMSGALFAQFFPAFTATLSNLSLSIPTLRDAAAYSAPAVSCAKYETANFTVASEFMPAGGKICDTAYNTDTLCNCLGGITRLYRSQNLGQCVVLRTKSTSALCRDAVPCLRRFYADQISDSLFATLTSGDTCLQAERALQVDQFAGVPSGEFVGTPIHTRCMQSLCGIQQLVPALHQCDFGGTDGAAVCAPYLEDNFGATAASGAALRFRASFAISASVNASVAESPAMIKLAMQAANNDTAYLRAVPGDDYNWVTFVDYNWTSPPTVSIYVNVGVPIIDGNVVAGLNSSNRFTNLRSILSRLPGSTPKDAFPLVGLVVTRFSKSSTLAPGDRPKLAMQWSCFVDYPVGYYSATEGVYFALLMCVAVYGLWTLFILARASLSREVDYLRLIFTGVLGLAILCFVVFWEAMLFSSIGLVNGAEICYMSKPSDGADDPIDGACRDATHKFSAVSVATGWITYWGCYLLIWPLVKCRTMASDRQSPRSVRIGQAAAFLATDFFPWIIAPGFVTLNTRPLYTGCVTSPLALYDQEIAAVYLPIFSLSVIAAFHDMCQNGHQYFSWLSVILPIHIVFGLGYSIVYMATLQSGGWASYIVGNTIPIQIALFHHIAFLYFARRPLWARDPLEVMLPYGLNLDEEELKQPVVSIVTICPQYYPNRVRLADFEKDIEDDNIKSTAALCSHIKHLTYTREARTYNAGGGFNHVAIDWKTLCLNLFAQSNLAVGADRGMSSAERSLLSIFVSDTNLQDAIGALLGGARFSGSEEPWFDYHLNVDGRGAPSSLTLLIRCVLQALSKCPIVQMSSTRSSAHRALKITDANELAKYRGVGNQISWTRIVKVHFDESNAIAAANAPTVVVELPVSACRDVWNATCQPTLSASMRREDHLVAFVLPETRFQVVSCRTVGAMDHVKLSVV